MICLKSVVLIDFILWPLFSRKEVTLTPRVEEHGSVYWGQDGEHALQNLQESKSLEVQLHHAFSYPYSPNWQDSSTEIQCNLFDRHLGDENQLAVHTGSKAHHVS